MSKLFIVSEDENVITTWQTYSSTANLLMEIIDVSRRIKPLCFNDLHKNNKIIFDPTLKESIPFSNLQTILKCFNPKNMIICANKSLFPMTFLFSMIGIDKIYTDINVDEFLSNGNFYSNATYKIDATHFPTRLYFEVWNMINSPNFIKKMNHIADLGFYLSAGLNQTEISKLLNISPRTVSNSITRCNAWVKNITAKDWCEMYSIADAFVIQATGNSLQNSPKLDLLNK